MMMLTFVTCYRSRYHRPRGFRNFRGDVFVLGDALVRLFGFTVSGVWIGSEMGCVMLLIQCFCGKSFSEIFCTQTNGCRFRSICDSLVGDRKYFDRVDIFFRVRSKILVVVADVAIVLIYGKVQIILPKNISNNEWHTILPKNTHNVQRKRYEKLFKTN